MHKEFNEFLMHTFLKFIVLLEDLTCDHDNDHKNKKSKMHFATITLFCHQGNLVTSSSDYRSHYRITVH